MRWLLLDEVVSIEKKVRALTRGRIPAGSVSPEVLMVEMMAQTGALLLGAEKDFCEDVIFAKIESAVFFQENVKPGAPVQIEALSQDLRSDGAWLDAAIRGVDGEVAKSRFMLINVGHLVPGQTRPVSFHPAFMEYFRVREKLR